MDLLIWVLLIVGALGVAGWSYQRKRMRREDLAAMARHLGLEYSPEDANGCLGLPFALLQRGDGRGAENVCRGPGRACRSASSTTGTSRNPPTRTATGPGRPRRSRARSPRSRPALSPLTLGRENLFTRLADQIGLADVEFELDEFNRAFTVKSRDRKFANDFVDQRMMRWLLTADASFAFEACGRWLLVYSKRRRPTELIPLLGTLERFRDMVPRVVYDLYGLRATG